MCKACNAANLHTLIISQIIQWALLGGGGGGVTHPLSLKYRGQLSLIPKITETVIAKTAYIFGIRQLVAILKCEATHFLIDNLILHNYTKTLQFYMPLT